MDVSERQERTGRSLVPEQMPDELASRTGKRGSGRSPAGVCDPGASCRIVSVISNEPDSGLGDGDTAGDIEITGDLTLRLRAERSGSGTGRTYTLVVECADAETNKTQQSVTVTVPKNQRGK